MTILDKLSNKETNFLTTKKKDSNTKQIKAVRSFVISSSSKQAKNPNNSSFNNDLVEVCRNESRRKRRIEKQTSCKSIENDTKKGDQLTGVPKLENYPSQGETKSNHLVETPPLKIKDKKNIIAESSEHDHVQSAERVIEGSDGEPVSLVKVSGDQVELNMGSPQNPSFIPAFDPVNQTAKV